MSIPVALMAGGYSGEFVISVQSAALIGAHLDPVEFEVYTLLITRNSWSWQSPEGDQIEVNRNDFSLSYRGRTIRFKAVFIAIHGTPGEDGRLQGYLDMLSIPYTGCGLVTSALTFNKSFCNQVVKSFGVVQVADSVHLIRGKHYDCEAILGRTGLPCFVKPNEGGSSIGMSRVNFAKDLPGALEKAFLEDDQLIVEHFIRGREFTCGLYRSGGKLKVLPVTEIISTNEFFDYEAKYTPGKSREVTPAEAPRQVLDKISTTSEELYTRLDCRGIVRIDYILREEDGALFFLEANTMPGQSENSLVPQQVRASGMTLGVFYGNLIRECLSPSQACFD
ncbi:MAG TPA: D-alanine--D-alanine ligase [Chitinophagaceae bacterium]|nr:D-alanine--D-alanine ligase [Chitinophagaceae bacterium]